MPPPEPGQKRRQRSVVYNFGTTNGKGYDPNGNVIQTYSVDLGKAVGSQVTDSKGHSWPPPKGKFSGDIGGNFFSQNRYMVGFDKSNYYLSDKQFSSRQFLTQYSGSIDGYVYPVGPGSPPNYNFPDPHNSSNSELEAWGATAIARCKPTSSPADLVTFLGETLKDGLPLIPGISLLEKKLLHPAQAGGEFLNWEFGIQPLISDVNKFIDATRHTDKVLSQFERDAGKLVRRSFRFPRVFKELSRTVTSISGSAPAPAYGMLGGDTIATSSLYDPSLNVGKPAVEIVEELTQNRWFKGAFTYHLPTGYDSRLKLRGLAEKVNVVYGTKLTPGRLYNLAPWSWAADWFGSTGDVLNNISDVAQYGLVMPWGYIMEHTIVRRVYTQVGVNFKSKSIQPVPPLVFVTETKIRRQANPFGFGVSYDSLSGSQLAILAALGISRGG